MENKYPARMESPLESMKKAIADLREYHKTMNDALAKLGITPPLIAERKDEE